MALDAIDTPISRLGQFASRGDMLTQAQHRHHRSLAGMTSVPIIDAQRRRRSARRPAGIIMRGSSDHRVKSARVSSGENIIIVA